MLAIEGLHFGLLVQETITVITLRTRVKAPELWEQMERNSPGIHSSGKQKVNLLRQQNQGIELASRRNTAQGLRAASAGPSQGLGVRMQETCLQLPCSKGL